MALKKKSIYGMDEELFRKAKAAAASQGKTLGQWFNEAIAEKIHIHDAGKKRGK